MGLYATVGLSTRSEGASVLNQRSWHADEWRLAEGTAGGHIEDKRALSAASVQRLLTLRETPVVYLTMDGLEQGDGDALLRQLPHGLRCVCSLRSPLRGQRRSLVDPQCGSDTRADTRAV